MRTVKLKVVESEAGFFIFATEQINCMVTDPAIVRVIKASFDKSDKKTKKDEKTSKYTGVSWDSKAMKWKSQIYHNGKVNYIGIFENEEKAAKAYDYEYRQIHGVNKNFPEISRKIPTFTGNDKPKNLMTEVFK